MIGVREVVRETLHILKGKKLQDNAISTHKNLSVWKKFAGLEHPWRQIKAPPKSHIHHGTSEKKEHTTSHSSQKNIHSTHGKEEFKLEAESVKREKETDPGQPLLFTNLPKIKNSPYPNKRPVYVPGKINDLGSLITEIKNSLLNSGLESKAKEFLELAYKGENDLNKILNICYRFVSISSDNVNKITRSLVSEKVKETKRTLSEAMLGNDNASGEHDVQASTPKILQSSFLPEIIKELNEDGLSVSDKKFIERVKTSIERKQIPHTIKTKINEELARLEIKEPSIVLKIIKTYISDSLLKYNEKNNPKPIDDDSPIKRSVISSKFRHLADNMEEAIQHKESPPISRQNKTRRRIGIAASMYDQSVKLRKIQAALYGLANEVEDGKLPEYLKSIKSKNDIEEIISTYKHLDYYRQIPNSKELNPLDSKVSVRFYKFPLDSFYEDTQKEIRISSDGKVNNHSLDWALKKGLITKAEYKTILKHTSKDKNSHYESFQVSDLENAEELKRIYDLKDNLKDNLYVKPAEKKSKNTVLINGTKYEFYFKGKKDRSNYQKSIIKILRLGLDTYKKVEDAGKYIQALSENNKGRGPDPKKREIQKLEENLVGVKIPGFFPTPKLLAQRLVKEAEISSGMEVLEPSAGKGDLSEEIQNLTGIKPDTIEYFSSLREILQKKDFNLVGSDFLEFKDKLYDRIIMNPPFEKGQDLEHVQHAYSLLKPGGRLVSIMSEGPFYREDSKAKNFRKWLEDVDGESEQLPSGSFLGRDSFRQTGVNTRIVIIEKPKAKTNSKITNFETKITDESFDSKSLSEAMRGNKNAEGEHSTVKNLESEVYNSHPNTNDQVLESIDKDDPPKDTIKKIDLTDVKTLLDHKEKNKEFKDVNDRVPGSRKEMAAIAKLLKLSDLNKLDSATAERVVKKDRVLPPFDFTEYKNKGEEGGLVFLKSKLYDSIASKPADSDYARKEYVLNLKDILDPILNAKSIAEITQYANSFSRRTLHDYKIIVRSEIDNFQKEILSSDRTKSSMDSISEKFKKIIGDMVPGAESIIEKIVGGEIKQSFEIDRELYSLMNKYYFVSDTNKGLRMLPSVYGDRFFNLLMCRTDPSIRVWREALQYNPLSEETAAKKYKDYVEKKKLHSINQSTTFLKIYPTLKEFKIKNPQYSDEAANKIFTERTSIKESITREEWSRIPLNNVRDSDWSWAEKKKSEKKNTPNNSNLKRLPLGIILRENGRTISPGEISSKALTEEWGFKSVQFGNYMDDKSSKDHLTRFVASLKDLEDALEIDMKRAITQGNLNMAFGARGKPGQSASYSSSFRIINVTKTKGDGSVAHEFGHYFDHLCTENDAKRDKSHFITINPKGVFSDSIKKLFTVIKNNPDGTKTNFYQNALSTGSKELVQREELFARGFEAYVEDKLAEKGMMNTYLVSPNRITEGMHPILAFQNEIKYPQGEERTRIVNAIDDFVNVFKNKFHLLKPLDKTAPRISSQFENYITISDIVKEKKKKNPISLFKDET
ncbi:LPD1 domain-containing protein [Leptospira kmetyi]|uniref:LPD1 domain-containing protein n=1 Tax=Leptospira kmetyi TaxID=408139 RepID=UPI00039065B1|nr:LPD1 domain-containing protein [Leptospira kmetyi]EQA55365.1 methyltransferase small domain protein [Leptospira kmetyi serovar Malaysia str. Bejo-Iso9]